MHTQTSAQNKKKGETWGLWEEHRSLRAIIQRGASEAGTEKIAEWFSKEIMTIVAETRAQLLTEKHHANDVTAVRCARRAGGGYWWAQTPELCCSAQVNKELIQEA